MGLGMRLKSKKICPGFSAELGTSIPLLRQADRPAFQLVEDLKAEFHSGSGMLMWVGDRDQKKMLTKVLGSEGDYPFCYLMDEKASWGSRIIASHFSL